MNKQSDFQDFLSENFLSSVVKESEDTEPNLLSADAERLAEVYKSLVDEYLKQCDNNGKYFDKYSFSSYVKNRYEGL